MSIIAIVIQKEVAGSAPVARRQDKLLEESEAVRPQKKKNLLEGFLKLIFIISPHWLIDKWLTASFKGN